MAQGAWRTLSSETAPRTSARKPSNHSRHFLHTFSGLFPRNGCLRAAAPLSAPRHWEEFQDQSTGNPTPPNALAPTPSRDSCF